MNKEYLNRLKKSECQDSTYLPSSDPLVFAHGSESTVYDVEGKSYTDLCAGFGALSLGHNPSEFNEIFSSRSSGINSPITHGLGDVYPSKAKVELLEKLISALPDHLTHATLSLTGSHAVETAIKTALQATGGSKIISFDDGYHGVDFGVLPLTSREDFKAPFSKWLSSDSSVFLPYMCEESILEDAVQKISSSALAAIVVEPIQGRGGVNVASSSWLLMLKKLAKKHGALLIFDEVFTGLGRSGRLTYSDEIACDLLCLGKGLGGGFPISACIGTKEAMSSWPESRGEAIHTGTFFGHPLSCEIAAKTLETVTSQNLADRAKALGEKAKSFLKEKLSKNSEIAEIRGEGLMLALVYKQAGRGAEMMDGLRTKGVLALAAGKRGECLSITPALNIDEKVFFAALEIIISSTSEL